MCLFQPARLSGLSAERVGASLNNGSPTSLSASFKWAIAFLLDIFPAMRDLKKMDTSSSQAPLKTSRVTPDVIEYVWRTIVEAVHPVKIIMFGSQADGTAGKDSDLDLFIIHDLPQPSRQVRRQIGQLFLHRHFGLDLIVRNREQVEANLADRNPFYTEHIFKRGVVLYERGK